MYEPSDSPFGDAYRDWLAGGGVGGTGLNHISQANADEYASCGHALLGCPCYAYDAQLARFVAALDCRAMVKS